MSQEPTTEGHQARAMQRYYALHSGVYDATRWSFLFGRKALITEIAMNLVTPQRILEVGCGTGHNLRLLAQAFPDSEITGLDLSADMLEIAKHRVPERVKLLQASYDQPISGKQDLVLCSYALSMFNPGWGAAIDCASADLAPGGHFALVDFHRTSSRWFRAWMGYNHVRMDGHLRHALRERFTSVIDRSRPAYGDLWRYLTFVGVKRV
jgi:S-adenosylmethionine-diacylgycerolhomoserine-N-methlytransferase